MPACVCKIIQENQLHSSKLLQNNQTRKTIENTTKIKLILKILKILKFLENKTFVLFCTEF